MLLRTVLAIVAAVAATGCEDVTSRNPLTSPESARPDPRLVGLWVAGDGESRSLVDIASGEGAALDLVIVTRDTARDRDATRRAEVLRCDAFPSVVAGRSYLNARCPEARSKGNREPYDILRYEARKDGTLALWFMDAGLVKEAIRAGQLAGALDCGAPPKENEPPPTFAPSCDAMIAADGPALAAFVAKADPAKLFDHDPIVLRPVRLPKWQAAKPVATQPKKTRPPAPGAVARQKARTLP